MLYLPNRMPGDNISILNTFYKYPQKIENKEDNKKAK